MKQRTLWLGLGLAACAVVALGGSTLYAQAGSAAQVPVVDTHKLMDLLFKAPQKELKELMAEEPTERRAWNKMRDTVSILAEVSNLVLLRDGLEYEKTEEWAELAVQSRDAAIAVLEPIQANDYPAAKEKYLVMIESCNACHTRFEPEVAPKLEP
jgi:hypothetical protein